VGLVMGIAGKFDALKLLPKLLPVLIFDEEFWY